MQKDENFRSTLHKKKSHMNNNHKNHSPIIALKEAAVRDPLVIVGVHAEQGDQSAENAKLNIPHPNADLSALEDLLKVNASKTRAHASAEQSRQTD